MASQAMVQARGRLNPADYIYKQRQGEVLVKLPGTVAGNGFVLDRLHDCQVLLLDHSSQVQVDDCVGCTILIGPCDGSVFVRDCTDCTLFVATRQLRTRDCKDLRISLYCATNPSIETSTAVTFSCWRAAYPGLSTQFAAAKLDPLKNTWTQVYDFNSAEAHLGAPHFSLSHSFPGWWEVAAVPGVDGWPSGPCECPVLAADGSGYAGAGVTATATTSDAGTVHDGDHAVNGPDSVGSHALTAEVETLLDPVPSTAPPPSPEPPAAARQGQARGWDEEVAFDDDDDDIDDGVTRPGQQAAPAPPGPQPAQAQGADGGAWLHAPMPPSLEGVAAPGAAACLLHDEEADVGSSVADSVREDDARLQWAAQNARRIKQLDAQEAAAKETAVQAAARKLADLRQARQGLLQARHQTHVEAQSTVAEAEAAAQNPTDSSGWAKVAAMVDAAGAAGGAATGPAAATLPGHRSGASDRSRLRGLIMALKHRR